MLLLITVSLLRALRTHPCHWICGIITKFHLLDDLLLLKSVERFYVESHVPRCSTIQISPHTKKNVSGKAQNHGEGRLNSRCQLIHPYSPCELFLLLLITLPLLLHRTLRSIVALFVELEAVYVAQVFLAIV
jgi:hypothetical protein